MRNPNRLLSQDEVIRQLNEHPDVLKAARRVGRWIWVEFDVIPSPEVRKWLGELGFHWNRKRQVWQHPCGRFSKASQDDPRWKYGSFPLAEALSPRFEEEEVA